MKQRAVNLRDASADVNFVEYERNVHEANSRMIEPSGMLK